MISISFLTSKYDINKTIELITETEADYIHVDMMDGLFVPSFNYNIDEFVSILKDSKKKLDVHVMVEDPLKYIEAYSKLNTEYYTFHYEAVDDVFKVIEEIKKYGMKAGLAINPETPIDKIKPYLEEIDLVLIMSVKPGYGGQKFMMEVLPKIEELNILKKKFIISVDGGVNDTNNKLLIDIGVDMLVVGSFVCQSDNYNDKIKQLKCL